jgi:RNA polymerase sigma-70 factor (ECF subfamily)
MLPGTSKSLLQRLAAGSDQEAWDRMHKLYSPWIHRWGTRAGLQQHDADDLVQDVMRELVRAMPRFEYKSERGMFRSWLKTIFVNRMRVFRRRRTPIPIGGGDDDREGDVLAQLADGKSDLSQAWDQEYDRELIDRLMALVEPEFESITWKAFKLVTIGGAGPAKAALDLGMTPNAVYQAKHRVLSRMREELAGMADF